MNAEYTAAYKRVEEAFTKQAAANVTASAEAALIVLQRRYESLELPDSFWVDMSKAGVIILVVARENTALDTDSLVDEILARVYLCPD